MTYPWMPDNPTVTPVYPTKMVKRTTRTVEKYGPEGEYLGKEIITEDTEDVEVPDYNYPAQPYYDYPITISETELCGTIISDGVSTISQPLGGTTISCTYFDSKTPFTYTKN